MKRWTLLFLGCALFAGTVASQVDAQSGPASPIIKASTSFANETGALPQTTLFTPGATGEFRVSIYIEVFGASGYSAVFASLGWTDDGGQKPLSGESPIGADASGVSYGENVLFVHDLANAPITLSVNYPSLPAGASYTIFAVVEKL